MSLRRESTAVGACPGPWDIKVDCNGTTGEAVEVAKAPPGTFLVGNDGERA